MELVSEGNYCYQSTVYDDATMGSLTADEMLMLGAFSSTIRSSLWLTLNLAVKELNEAGGLPVARKLRPVLLTLCDDRLENVPSAVDHLVNGLQVHAILGSLEDAPLRSALLIPSTRGRALFLSPNESASGLDELGRSANLLWYLGNAYERVVETYPGAFRRLVDAVVARGTPMNEIRTISLIGGADEDRKLATAVRDAIDIGGRSAVALQAFDDRYREIELDERLATKREEQLRDVVAYAPQIILVFAGGVFHDEARPARAGVVRLLEDNTHAEWQPLYLFGPRNVDDPALRRLAATRESFRQRALGLHANPSAHLPLATTVDERFRAAFPAAVVGEINLTLALRGYDALYHLAYALAAGTQSNGSWSGEGVAAGLRAIGTGGAESVPVGPDGIERGRELLDAGMPFTLLGTTGEARFELDSHDRAAPTLTYCWNELGDLSESGPVEDAILFPPGNCARELSILLEE